MKYFTLPIFLIITSTLFGQVPKKVIVEHFTNTKCSICANKNPGFYSNLATQTEVLHLAIHPSSPYQACILSQQNMPDNDDRTNYYGVYGGTPRIILQGTVLSSSTDYSNSAIFTPYLNQTSPISIGIKQHKFGVDSIRSTITVKTVATHSLGNLKLFVALAEDTIFYTSPNGEQLHHDVFRKSLFGATGVTITAPATVGDSAVYEVTTAANVLWNFARIYTIALLQDETTKEVVQAEAVAANQQDDIATGIANTQAIEAAIFPNPTNGFVTIQLNNNLPSVATVLTIDGRLITSDKFYKATTLNLDALPKGLYFITVTNTLGRIAKKVSVE